MNPDTNKFEQIVETVDLQKMVDEQPVLLRPNGEPVPKHWTILTKDELVVIKDYTFQVVHIGESYLLLEPTGPLVVGER